MSLKYLKNANSMLIVKVFNYTDFAVSAFSWKACEPLAAARRSYKRTILISKLGDHQIKLFLLISELCVWKTKKSNLQRTAESATIFRKRIWDYTVKCCNYNKFPEDSWKRPELFQEKEEGEGCISETGFINWYFQFSHFTDKTIIQKTNKRCIHTNWSAVL